MNRERCEQVLQWIEAHPEHWDQQAWHCGTTHCFAGVAEMMRIGEDPSGRVPDEICDGKSCGPAPGYLISPSQTATWLGFDYQSQDGYSAWEKLTRPDNTLDGLRRMIRGAA